jgi:hypothetical protein
MHDPRFQNLDLGHAKLTFRQRGRMPFAISATIAGVINIGRAPAPVEASQIAPLAAFDRSSKCPDLFG